MNTLRSLTARRAGLLLPVIALALGLGFLLGQVSSAGAGSTYTYSLMANTMQPSDSTIQFNIFQTAFLTTSANSTIPGNATGYNGQINLPDGATITGLGCEGRDTDPTAEFQLYMSRFSIDNPITVWDIISIGASSGVAFQGGNVKVSGGIVTENNRHIVNNALYSYNVYVLMPKASDGAFLGVLRCWVSAAYPVSLPLVRK